MEWMKSYSAKSPYCLISAYVEVSSYSWSKEWLRIILDIGSKHGLKFMVTNPERTEELRSEKLYHREHSVYYEISSFQSSMKGLFAVVDVDFGESIFGCCLQLNSRSQVDLFRAQQHRCCRFFKFLMIEFACYSGFIILREVESDPIEQLLFGGNSERIERFNKPEWPQDTERALMFDWLSKPGAEVISREGENLYVVTGNQKALLLQSPINGMLVPVFAEARSQYHQFNDDAWECEFEKTVPFASLDDWIDQYGPPDFELPAVDFDGSRQNVVRQIGYLNMSPNYVVILRRYEDGTITVNLAGKVLDSQ